MANEKRLIEVSDENIKAILEKVPYYPDEIWKFTAMTMRFPTVDAVEVVRCKDCKHWNESDSVFCTANKECRCRYWKGLFDYCKPNDFCSCGERR